MGWQAAKTDSEREIAVLKAHINVLREALEEITPLTNNYNGEVGCAAYKLHMKCKQALSATPAQSLQAHDNEVIERCAKVCDNAVLQGTYSLSKAIRALKGKV